MYEIYVGGDPELFVQGKSGFISGHLFPCGSKEEPRTTEHGSVQVDGIALEFNIKPSQTSKEFVENLKNVLADLNKIVSVNAPGAHLVAIPTAEVGEEFLSKVPEANRRLGCNPDYNGYTMQVNPLPNAELPFRTGSGHVHVGFCDPKDSNLEDYEHFIQCGRWARQLDYFLGLPSLKWDSDDRRRQLYGKAGCFRPKAYGMEYRTLSNAWVENENLAHFIFEQTKKAQLFLEEGRDLVGEFGEYAQHAIDNCDADWMTSRPDIAEIVLG